MYEINIQYPISELENIAKWWQTNRQYDINEHDDYIEIVKRTDEQIIKDLRTRREYECFPYVNRGSLWYEMLTDEQKAEFKSWYSAWLNVTDTLCVPTKPLWLDVQKPQSQTKYEEEIASDETVEDV